MNHTKDEFLMSAIETMLWATIDDNDKPLDSNFDYSDIDQTDADRFSKDCEKFCEDVDDHFGSHRNLQNFNEYQIAGHDYWLTRNRHGGGYWDGDYPEKEGQVLTTRAEKDCELYPYVGDNGKIYIY